MQLSLRILRFHVMVFPLLLGLALTAVSTVRAEEVGREFDGTWDTILSCPNSNGALGFSFRFSSIVKEGALHAEKGEKNQPGWMRLDGRILKDGSANLYVEGLVGAAAFAVGQRPAGTSYGYHVASQFSARSGTGTRVEGRPCTITFTKSTPEN